MAKLTSELTFRAFMVSELLRSIEEEFPMQLAACFFWIGSHNGCLQEDIAKNCGLSAASVSRNVSWLGPRHRLAHRNGLRLVRRERDPDNWRRWRIWLTPKGARLVHFLEIHLTLDLTSLQALFEKDRQFYLSDTAYDDEDFDTEDLG